MHNSKSTYMTDTKHESKIILKPAELGAPSANLVEETRRRQQNNDETHVDSDSPSKNPAVRSVAYAGYPTNRTLFDPDTKLTPAIPELNPENHNRARSYSIQSFKSQVKKQHRISLPYYYHLHSLSKIFSQGPRIGRIRSIPAVYRHSERVLQVSETIA